MPDHRADSTALRTRSRCHHLTEKRPGHLTDLAAPLAHLAGVGMRTRRGARARTRRADHGGLDVEFFRGAEYRLDQIDLDVDQRVVALAGAGAWSATAAATSEERVHDVAEPTESGAKTTIAGRRQGVAAHVVQLSLAGIGEHLVGRGDLLEPFLRVLVRIHVRVQLPG